MSSIASRSRRPWRAAMCVAGLVSFVVVAGPAQPSAAAPATNVIVLPGASSTEGIAVGQGATFYATELFGGDIFRGNLQRGTVERLVDAPEGRMAVGLKFDGRSGLLLVAGGQTAQGFAYDARTGAEVATVPLGTVGSSFINDVAITREGAWFTDSLQPNLYFVPISPTGTLGAVSVLTVTGPAADTSGDFNINGITSTPNGRTLIVSHSGTNALYTVDPETGQSATLLSIAGPDGILYEAGRLWVAQPFLNQITQLRVSPQLTGAVVEEVITSNLFQIPTTVARFGSRIATVNAKFNTGFPPTAAQYEVVIVKG